LAPKSAPPEFVCATARLARISNDEATIAEVAKVHAAH
jgi:hypothetical protein